MRLRSYLAIAVSLALGILAAIFSSQMTQTYHVSPVPSLSVSSDHATASLPDSSAKSRTSVGSIASSRPETGPSPAKTKALRAETSSTTARQSPSPSTPSLTEEDALNISASRLRAALVNIICYVPAGSGLHSISGSGVFIDPRGVILTNAHIAQYFLLADRGVSCSIRSGTPAKGRYDAALIFISPEWIRANVGVLTETAPNGTGEYDFAFLAVTKSTTDTPLPASFPSIPIAQTPPTPGTPVVIASYGAQFLNSAQVESALFPTVVFGSVKGVFTFKTNTIDLIALGGSAAAQEGSSGGGVADSSGDLVGTITTSTVDGPTSSRSLNAITASYIRAEYASETGQALDILLAKPTSSAIADFAPQMPALESTLTLPLP